MHPSIPNDYTQRQLMHSPESSNAIYSSPTLHLHIIYKTSCELTRLDSLARSPIVYILAEAVVRASGHPQTFQSVRRPSTEPWTCRRTSQGAILYPLRMQEDHLGTKSAAMSHQILGFRVCRPCK